MHIGIIFFIQTVNIIYLLPITFKFIGDYWLCSIFLYKIKTNFPILEFLVLSIIHPIYVVSLGLSSPFSNYTWKDND